MRVSLSFKMISAILAVFIFAGLPVLLLCIQVLEQGFLRVEDKYILREQNDVYGAFEQEQQSILSLCREYAAWDDTVAFLKGELPNYVDNNLFDTWYKEANIDVLLITKLDGSLPYSRWPDSIIPNEAINSVLFAMQNRLRSENSTNLTTASIFEVLRFGESFVALALMPVLQSNFSGPSQGYFYMGRVLDQNFFNKVADTTGTKLQLNSYVSTKSFAEYKIKRTTTTLESLMHINLYDEESSAIELILTLPRDLWSTFQNTRLVFSLVIILGSVLLGLLVIIFSGVVIIRPLRILDKHMLGVLKTEDFSRAISWQRNDEIGDLARHYNLLLTHVSERTLELIKLNNDLDTISKTDRLTGLANRRMFDYFMSKELNRLRREQRNSPNRGYLTLLLCDIDYFKQFNDTYGHMAGDVCLSAVGRALESTLRRTTDLACRFGGEEFVIVLPDCTEAGGVLMAELLKDGIMDLEIPHQASKCAPVVTISIGVTSGLVGQDFDFDKLMETADKALYQAKQSGRNRVCSISTTSIG